VLGLLDLVGNRLCRDRDRRSKVGGRGDGKSRFMVEDRRLSSTGRVVVIISEAKDVFCS